MNLIVINNISDYRKFKTNVKKEKYKNINLVFNINSKLILPNTLTHLTLDGEFNLFLEKNVLPTSLKHLIFGDQYNQIIKHDLLPCLLTHLEFGMYYDKKIKLPVYSQNKYVLPASLEELTLGITYEHDFNIKDYKLSNLKKIILKSDDFFNGKICINKRCFKRYEYKKIEFYINKYRIKKYKILYKTIINHGFDHIDHEQHFSSKILNINRLIKKAIQKK